MSTPKVIILTGASRGIGFAIAQHLLRNSHKVFLVARTAEPMEKLKDKYPQQVEYLATDLKDFKAAEEVVESSLKSFSRIDGLVINHGLLQPLKRVADCSPEEWRSAFDVNFFSATAFIKASLPSLRDAQGRIILVSSGAAVGTYSTWGPYGASKAAMNHLGMTLAVEEPKVTTISIRPGVVDTDMQALIRENSSTMDVHDAAKFQSLHKDGKLLKPEQPGNVISRLVIDASNDFSGKFLSWNDPLLSQYQEA